MRTAIDLYTDEATKAYVRHAATFYFIGGETEASHCLIDHAFQVWDGCRIRIGLYIEDTLQRNNKIYHH